MRLFIFLCLLAGPAFADPLSDEKTRQVLAEGEVLRTEAARYDFDYPTDDANLTWTGSSFVELDVRYDGHFFRCRIDWNEYDYKTDPETRRFWRKVDERCDR